MYGDENGQQWRDPQTGAIEPFYLRLMRDLNVGN
jgi:hypothetical protein